MTEEWRHVENPDASLHVLLDGCEDYALSFSGDPDTETVTLYIMDTEEMLPVKPVFECDVEHFEFLLEQASGAKMNAQGDFPQMDGEL